VLDDLAEMLLKRMASLHKKGKEALAEYHLRNQQRADELVQTLHDLVSAYRREGSAEEKVAAIETLLPDQGEAVLERCEDHMAHAGDNYFPFVWRFYKSHRATLFRLLKSLPVKATTQDTTFEQTLRFLLENESRTGDWLACPKSSEDTASSLDLSWMPDTWWRLVTEQRHREDAPWRLNRRHFEVCVFTQLMLELKSGDLCLSGSDSSSSSGGGAPSARSAVKAIMSASSPSMALSSVVRLLPPSPSARTPSCHPSSLTAKITASPIIKTTSNG
jgi:hypothetical protein